MRAGAEGGGGEDDPFFGWFGGGGAREGAGVVSGDGILTGGARELILRAAGLSGALEGHVGEVVFGEGGGGLYAVRCGGACAQVM